MLINEFEKIGGFGIAAPSANIFGAVSPTLYDAVEDEIGKLLGVNDLILDGGQCEIGVESTIIDCRNLYPTILRPGSITNNLIEASINFRLIDKHDSRDVRAAGLLDSHYSPKARVVLNENTSPGDGFIAMSGISTPAGSIRLANPKSNNEYARELYKALRLGDQRGLKRIVVIPPTGDGIVVAILDRLEKASSKWSDKITY
jgi:L-threonylcarbamoyladenylate synthase